MATEAAVDEMKGAIVPARLVENDALFTGTERETLRQLAGEVAELAARPGEDEKRELWRRHNALEPTRPVIFCDPEHSWHEIIPDDSLVCENEIARQWEFRLRAEVFWGAKMKDDRTIEPYFDIGHIRSDMDWGLRETVIGQGEGRCHAWDAPVKTEADLEKLHLPVMKVDFQATDRLVEIAEETFGDLLTVRLKSSWWWTLGMSSTLARLRGLEQINWDMVDNPGIIHRLMTLLRDGTLAYLDDLESRGLLSLNCRGNYVGSGGLGWTDELPAPDFQGKVRPRDMWGFAESQETVYISPEMFDEFILQYQLTILERFGLNCYGCCESLDTRWHVVERIPNLRRVSISPWADRAHMAEMLGARHIFSMKPNPTDLAMDSFDEGRIRTTLRDDLRTTRDCRVEVIMKDNHTIREDPQRVVRWVQVAMEEAQAL